MLGRLFQRGFSLLEVLVAFTIMALSLGALYATLGGSLRSVARAGDVSRAALLAESLLAFYRQVPEGGIDVSGASEDGALTWRVRSDPFPIETRDGLTLPHPMQRLVVEIGGPEGPVGRPYVTLVPERALP